MPATHESAVNLAAARRARASRTDERRRWEIGRLTLHPPNRDTRYEGDEQPGHSHRICCKATA
jgi:hypothetical protein